MIKSICSIRQTRKNKISAYLTNYLSLLVDNMKAPTEDFRHKEALMHAMGLLANHMAQTQEYQ